MTKDTSPSRQNPIVNLVGFAMILLFAWFLKWESADLIWSLWLGSLLIGYFTIVGAVLSGLIVVGKIITTDAGEGLATGKQRALLGIGAIGVGLFFLAFFSFHFCAFHAGHAMFLKEFFPIDGIDLDSSGLSNAFMNPLLLLKIAITKIAPFYIWFLIPALLLDWKKVAGPILIATNFKPDESGKKMDLSGMPSDPFFGPYKNVIKMHILIFFFAGALFLKLDNFFVYAIVYAVYFFPWSTLKLKKSNNTAPTAEVTS
ncbi:MAG: DUF6498-containing protein [Verrucomicrobiales bacterium]|nr:DUF6498-containing protein [Verrucomicrobiales bacterium]